MPANLTAKYLKAERAYRQAATPADELQCLQVMLRELPKHKGTDKLQADLKRKISRVRDKATQPAASGAGYRVKIPRQGAGRCILLGGPNAGKSSLLEALTHARPETGPYPFTTREPSVGMLNHQDVLIQLIDTPPITADHLPTYMQGLIRGADLALLAVDMASETGLEDLQAVLDRLEQTKTRLDRSSWLDGEDIGRSYTRTILVLNKSDAPDFETTAELMAELAIVDLPSVTVSCQAGNGLADLSRTVYAALDLVRVYTKSPAEKEARLESPFAIRRGETLYEVASQVHEDFAKDLKFARIWSGTQHAGTRVGGEYEPADGDIVEFHVR